MIIRTLALIASLALAGCLHTQPNVSSAPVPKIVSLCANLAGIVRDTNRQRRIGNVSDDLYRSLAPGFEAGTLICDTPASEIAPGDTEQLENILEGIIVAQGEQG